MGPLLFFTIEPEASGSPLGGGTQEAVSFDTWLGDDVVRAFPALMVTTPVKQALDELPRATGFSCLRARVRASPFFRKHSPGKRLPVFWTVQARGQAGRDDIGLTAAGVVVISPRVLDVLMRFRIGRAVMMQYVPGEPEPGRAVRSARRAR